MDVISKGRAAKARPLLSADEFLSDRSLRLRLQGPEIRPKRKRACRQFQRQAQDWPHELNDRSVCDRNLKVHVRRGWLTVDSGRTEVHQVDGLNQTIVHKRVERLDHPDVLGLTILVNG